MLATMYLGVLVDTGQALPICSPISQTTNSLEHPSMQRENTELLCLPLMSFPTAGWGQDCCVGSVRWGVPVGGSRGR